MLSRTLFAAVAKNCIGLAGDRAFREISEEAVQFGAR